MALHIKAAVLDKSIYDEPTNFGASKKHIKKRVELILNNFLDLCPDCSSWFVSNEKAIDTITDRLYSANEISSVEPYYYRIGNEGVYKVCDKVAYYRGLPSVVSGYILSGLALLMKKQNVNDVQDINQAFCFEQKTAVEFWNDYISNINWNDYRLPKNMEYFNPKAQKSNLYDCYSETDRIPIDVTLARKYVINDYYDEYVLRKVGAELFHHKIEEYYKFSREHYRFRYALRKLSDNPIKAEYYTDSGMIVLHLNTSMPRAEMAFLELISWPKNNIEDNRNLIFSDCFKDIVFGMLENLNINILEKQYAKL